ncbi:hypothetical protein RDI58_019416 [Solanum bulbocastanum]|uniref:PUA domain-containing protein n=1 Tax=Solanum bulbocastanum TaxID=147425 RepID=A0AAN8T6P4_SOLBU
MNLSSTFDKAKEVQGQFKGKKVIMGVDDMDIFKGIILKLLAFEYLLQQNHNLQGKLVLVQIVNPALARYEKTAYYAVAECCLVNVVRDGMNLMPYKYIVCRQGSPGMDDDMGIKADSPRTSMLVMLEFIGCSPSPSGATRVQFFDLFSSGFDLFGSGDNKGKPLKEVIVSRKCAEAVLRGAQVYVPGVLACSAHVERGDIVAVSVVVEQYGPNGGWDLKFCKA